MAQVAEHILGKDEVTSSNLVSSSIKIPEIKGFSLKGTKIDQWVKAGTG